jgi:hypothetical protein
MMLNGIAYRLPPLVPRISGTESLFWPTARATDGSKGSRTHEGAAKDLARGKNIDLCVAVKMWPTPRAADSKRGPDYGGTANHQGGGNLLGAVKTADKSSGQLNPEWVEWLMGFPVGWTDCEVSETPLSHK